jgi:hypothetical protein
MDPSPETPAPVKPAAPSTPLPKASVPLTPSAVKPSVPAVKVLGIGSAGAYRSSIISIDGNIIMASEGMKIGDSLIVKKIADASVVFVYKNREFVKNLGDVE